MTRIWWTRQPKKYSLETWREAFLKWKEISNCKLWWIGWKIQKCIAGVLEIKMTSFSLVDQYFKVWNPGPKNDCISCHFLRNKDVSQLWYKLGRIHEENTFYMSQFYAKIFINCTIFYVCPKIFNNCVIFAKFASDFSGRDILDQFHQIETVQLLKASFFLKFCQREKSNSSGITFCWIRVNSLNKSIASVVIVR